MHWLVVVYDLINKHLITVYYNYRYNHIQYPTSPPTSFLLGWKQENLWSQWVHLVTMHHFGHEESSSLKTGLPWQVDLLCMHWLWFFALYLYWLLPFSVIILCLDWLCSFTLHLSWDRVPRTWLWRQWRTFHLLCIHGTVCRDQWMCLV